MLTATPPSSNYSKATPQNQTKNKYRTLRNNNNNNNTSSQNLNHNSSNNKNSNNNEINLITSLVTEIKSINEICDFNNLLNQIKILNANLRKHINDKKAQLDAIIDFTT